MARTVAVKRAVAGQNRSITVLVRRDGVDDVTVSLSATADCATPAAICTADGRKLSTAPSAMVRGPVALSVADARANESQDAIAYTVSLSRVASGEVRPKFNSRPRI